MNGFAPLLRLRGLEIVRTWRSWALPAVMILLAAGGAVTARFTNEILSAVLAGEDFAVVLPEPTAADATAQWIKSFTQIVVLVVAVIAATTINTEVRSGAAAILLVKPASRSAYVLTHALAQFLLVAFSALSAAIVCWITTTLLFGAADLGPMLGATTVALVLAAVVISASLLASATINSVAGAAGIGIGSFFALATMGIIPPLAEYTPAGLLQVAGALAVGTQGNDHTLWWPIGTGVALTAALLAIAVAAFRRREI